MDVNMLKKIARWTIWSGLVVIILSPLYINSHLFFPFIVTKTIAFNIAVELMFLAFLFLAWKDNNYKIKINIVVALLAIYVVLLFVSSLFGDNFYRSFWSNNERSEGLLLFMHLFMLLVVLSGFLRRMVDWLKVFDIAFFSSFLVSLVALAQYFKLDFILASSGGQRLTGTIGNAGYMAGYLIFAIFFGLFLFFKRKDKNLKLYYLVVILLQFFVVLYTETRGGVLALSFGISIFVLYLLWFYFDHKRLKITAIVLVALAVLAPFLLFNNTDSEFVKNNRILSRMTSISVVDTTIQNRLMTWNIATQGFKERPIFGWGAENFYQPFDRYFNPKIYRHAGSVIWFDRAHNVIFDRLITGGILGLLSYLAFLFLPLYYIWKHFLREKNVKKYLTPLIFTLIIVSYFIQNLFIFEALVIYVPLLLSLAFMGMFGREYGVKFLDQKNVKKYLFVTVLVLTLPMIYFFNLRPLNANIQVVEVLSGKKFTTINQRFDALNLVLSQNTHGNQEYRQQYSNLFFNLLAQSPNNQDPKTRKIFTDFSNVLEVQLKEQIKENPHSTMNYLLLMRFNNLSYAYKPERLNDNLDLFKEVKKLSPNRAQVYYSIGNTHIRFADYFKQTKNQQGLEINLDLAVKYFKKALELNDQNTEPYKQLIGVLVFAERYDEAIEYAQAVKTVKRYNDSKWADEMIDQIEIRKAQ